MTKKRVIIVGGGFGGITAAKQLKNSNLELIVIDKTNHHLFQPLLYQVAAAALSPGDIAVPIRGILSKKNNVEVILSEVISVDKEQSCVRLKNREMKYDYLVLAPGSSHSYFGKKQWEEFAPGLKTLNDALTIRENILRSFEEAEIIEDKNIKNECLTFIIVGGGPTGVEMAGAIAEIAKKTMIKNFRNIKPEEAKIILVEAGSRILTAYSEKLSTIAKGDLEAMGVKVLVNTKITNVISGAVEMGNELIKSKNIIWAAGNEASPLLKTLNTELDRAGRVVVEPDLSVKSFPNIFVIGDAAHAADKRGDLLPGIAPVAIQQGNYIAKLINNEVNGLPRKPFVYFDKGTMATIGKAKAVARIGKFEFSQWIAWFLWSFIHIFFLITFRNRFRVMGEWIMYYFTGRRGVRLITKHPD
jgi:NADH:ubiquinone reductase (H+-translocating)